MTARPIPAFLRAPSADDIVARVRAALPALNVARKNARQALTGGPVSLDERTRVADLLDDAVAELYAAVHAPAPQAAPPPGAGPTAPRDLPARRGTLACHIHACHSGKHVWSSALDAAHCCNGYHRETRFDGLLPGDRARAQPVAGTAHWWVWVPDTGDAA